MTAEKELREAEDAFLDLCRARGWQALVVLYREDSGRLIVGANHGPGLSIAMLGSAIFQVSENASAIERDAAATPKGRAN